jgi:3-methylcrotonyl-CoA carboxylase alpha subunit
VSLSDGPDSRWLTVARDHEGFRIELDGESYRIRNVRRAGLRIGASIDGRPVAATIEHDSGRLRLRRLCRTFLFEEHSGRDPRSSVEHEGHLRAPMPGHVLDVRVTAGSRVTRGTVLVLLEAMKMEHALAAPWDALVTEVRVKAGERVDEGTELVLLAPQDTAAR